MYDEDNDYFYKLFLMVCKVMVYWPAYLLEGIIYSCVRETRLMNQVSEGLETHFWA